MNAIQTVKKELDKLNQENHELNDRLSVIKTQLLENAKQRKMFSEILQTLQDGSSRDSNT